MKIISFFRRHPNIKNILFFIIYLAVVYASYLAWSHYTAKLITNQYTSIQGRVKAENVKLKLLRNTKNIQNHRVLDEESLLSPAETSKYIREALLGKENLTLVSLTQEPGTKVQVSKLLGIINPPNKGLKLIKHPYHMKILCTYPAFLDGLKILNNINGLYWENINYKIESYPKALVTVQFYSLSRA